MDRRTFFRRLSAAAIGAAVAGVISDEDASSLLWTPSRKIFIPPVGGWVAAPSQFTQALADKYGIDVGIDYGKFSWGDAAGFVFYDRAVLAESAQRIQEHVDKQFLQECWPQHDS